MARTSSSTSAKNGSAMSSSMSSGKTSPSLSTSSGRTSSSKSKSEDKSRAKDNKKSSSSNKAASSHPSSSSPMDHTPSSPSPADHQDDLADSGTPHTADHDNFSMDVYLLEPGTTPGYTEYTFEESIYARTYPMSQLFHDVDDVLNNSNEEMNDETHQG